MKIGLEVHVQLLTKTKLFCSCPNRIVKEANTLVCETCLGFPGSKPRINATAVDYGIKVALALNCKLPKETFFSRKSYFYPDMSKNFQITQYEIPLAKGGLLKVNGKWIRIRRINLEEDPARIVHEGTITESKYVLVDYNRSGVPLCEIVTEPDFASPKEARAFLQELSSILEYLGVFDPNVEGSMRVDSNISLAENRVEVKNISGFKDVEQALSYEIIRQNNLLRSGKKIILETRAWDPASGITRSLREKEGEEDYGYIFEGDLPRVGITKNKIAEIKKSLPELAHEKIGRYENMGIAKDLAVSITTEPELARMFEEVINEIDKHIAANFFAKELKKTLNYNNLRIKDTGIESWHLIKLLRMVHEEKITVKTAELLLRKIINEPQDPEKLAGTRGVGRMSDESVLKPLVEEVLNENAKAILDYKAGKAGAFEFIVGQVMRKTEGRGDPETIRRLLKIMFGQ
ncbi:MAG: Asp-tRNA(Asn)/Glu-tRNA(Gln) amidotransferase subunit GatB [Candidatus Aenigmatarchaeota archaeon]